MSRWAPTAACIYDLKLVFQLRPGTQGESHLPEGKVAVIVAGPMLGTNVLSTSLIAWKAWCVVGNASLFWSALITDDPGNTAEPWAPNSEEVAHLIAWRAFSGF
jgi:hypothetical protein